MIHKKENVDRRDDAKFDTCRIFFDRTGVGQKCDTKERKILMEQVAKCLTQKGRF